jgi:hypothetical protein
MKLPELTCGTALVHSENAYFTLSSLLLNSGRSILERSVVSCSKILSMGSEERSRMPQARRVASKKEVIQDETKA